MKKKVFAAVVLAVTVALCAAFMFGCGNHSGPSGDNGSGDKTGEIVVETSGEGRKILRDIGVDITADKGKTQSTTEGVLEALEAVEGKEIDRYVSSGSSYSYVRLTFKVPSDKANEFVTALKNSYNVVSSREKITDVTDKYNAYKTKLDELTQRRATYDALYADPSALVADKLVILDKLDAINASIKEAEAGTSPYDGVGSYATVNVWIGSDGGEGAGIALTLVFGVAVPIGLAVALIIVGIRLSDAKKKLLKLEKPEE